MKLQRILGLPPSVRASRKDSHTMAGDEDIYDYSADSVMHAFPILHLIPAEPEFQLSQQGFRLNSTEAGNKFIDSLKTCNVDTDQKRLQVACMNTTVPSENFRNEFGESFMDTISNNMVTQGIKDMRFMAGGETGMNKYMKNIGDFISGYKGAGADSAKTLINKAKGGFDAGYSNLNNKQQSNASRFMNIARNVATGQSMDFPTVWKSANFNGSYSFNIRLYNQAPGDEKAHQECIVAPIAALLQFVVPRSSNGITFEYPFCCKFFMEGLIPMYAGYVSNLSIIKGGDDNSIGWNQRPGIVDIKLELGIFYQTMLNLSPGASTNNSHIPTLQDYIATFVEHRSVLDKDNTEKLAAYKNKLYIPGKEFTTQNSSSTTSDNANTADRNTLVSRSSNTLARTADLIDTGVTTGAGYVNNVTSFAADKVVSTIDYTTSWLKK